MKKKVWILAMVLSLAMLCPAAITITTADGRGADGGVSNDTNKQDTWLGGAVTVTEIRRTDGTRAKAAIFRFDLQGTGGDMSGPILSITETSGNRARTVYVYGLTDGSDDLWEEATLSYNTAPGLLSPELDGYFTLDGAAWKQVGTMNFVDNRGNGLPVSLVSNVDPNFIASDTNGLVSFLVYQGGGSDSSADYYVAMKENGTGIPALTFPNARYATNPVPAIDADVLPSLTTLSWTNTEPNDPSTAIACNVYLGSTEPNMAVAGYGLTQIASGTTATSIEIPQALRPLEETTYYWIVDSYDSSTPAPFLGTGAIWSFKVTALPLITADPQPQAVALGQTAEFSVAVESYSKAQYTWYHSADNANNTPTDDTQVGTDSNILSLVTVGTDEGYYYCKVVNKSGEANAVYSSTALLVVQRQVAHWSLNAADFVGGQYTDSSGEGHFADPNGPTPVFDAGVIAGNEGVVMDAQGFASAGTWNPSLYSNALTVSMWVKWNGSNGFYQNLLSKMDSWAANDMMWQFGISTDNQIGIICSGSSNVSNGSPIVGEWEFITLTFDGSTATVYRVVDDAIFFSTVSGSFSLGTDTAATLWLGASVSGGQLFNGTMDEIQIFNYSKNSAAIADLYNEMLSRDFCVLEYGSVDFELDVNNNCRIDMADFAALAANWMGCGLYPVTACP